MGAGLLAKASCQPMNMQAGPPPSRASPLPLWFYCGSRISGTPAIPVGAGLLAKASSQPMNMQAGPPPSGASPLPQWFCGGSRIRSYARDPRGSGLAREGVLSADDAAGQAGCAVATRADADGETG
ncbi:hypothetical protein EVS84_13675 [Pseudomonas koreensis]|uniref:Uncharacterized protein n=1 Tax=Pseudomonas koreensis TaxID=198620 RepID=A0A4Q4L6K6_9PSED|nr:hypothetical protein EVS84_13675 [Pseudomonas koreensis]